MSTTFIVSNVRLTLDDGSILTISARITEFHVSVSRSVIPALVRYEGGSRLFSFGFSSVSNLVRALERYRMKRGTKPG